MAPTTGVSTSDIFHFIAKLTARDATGGPSDKTPAQYAREGRYNYDPSFAASVVFAVLYAIVVLANLVQIVRHRAWFWWVMNLGVLLEFIGYIARAVSIKQLDNKNVFIVQTVFILVAPAVMAASCYMAFGRVVLWVVPPRYQSAKHLWLPARRITPVFVSCDILSFFVQVIGGAMVAGANTASHANQGKNVVLVGLAIQLATFGFFVLATIRFTIVLRTKLRTLALPTERNWRLFLLVVDVCSVLILIRTIMRFIEFATGTNNYLSNHEWFFYCFDSLLMFLVAAAFVCFHPGHYLPYLGFRRKNLQFSSNADNGLFSKFARGSSIVEVSSNELCRAG